MFRKNFDCQITQVKQDGEGRFVICTIEVEGQKFELYNLYAPNQDSPEFFEGILHEIKSNQDTQIILGGDPNVYLSEHDKQGGSKFEMSKSSELIDVFMDEYNWSDVWRYLNAEKFQFTWHGPTRIYSRLDYFMVPDGQLDHVRDCEIIPGFRSDHAFLKLHYAVNLSTKGPGFWKLNNLHLGRKEYVEGINEVIRLSEINSKNLSDKETWELMKSDFANFSQDFSRDFARKNRLKVEENGRKINALQKKLAMLNLSNEGIIAQIEKINQKIGNLQIELEKDSAYRTQGLMLRSKARWVEFSEKNNKYFLGLEKSKSKAKVMTNIINDRGELVENYQDVLKEQEKFYDKLYAEDKSIQFDLVNHTSQKLNLTQQTILESELTLEDLTEVLKKMQNRKSCGGDGLSVEFYQVFWHRIKQFFMDAVKVVYKEGKLFPSARQEFISLIQKKSDRRFLRHWRPICLLNVDAKF